MLKTLVPAGVAHEMHGDDTNTVKRDVISMFSDNGSSTTAHPGVLSNENTDHLHSQRIMDEHKEASVHIRPATNV